MNVNLPGVSVFWFASSRSKPGFPCKCYKMQIAPEGVSSAKGPVVIGSPLAGTMLAVYLRHDDAKCSDFAERRKMNTRQIIEVLKRRIKSGVMMLGASSTVRARAFGDGPDRAAVSTLKQVRAFGERVPDVITRG
jgi:hypothetical protein